MTARFGRLRVSTSPSLRSRERSVAPSSFAGALFSPTAKECSRSVRERLGAPVPDPRDDFDAREMLQHPRHPVWRGGVESVCWGLSR